MTDLHLSIAEIPITLSWEQLPPATVERVLGHYRAFRAEPSAESLRVQLRVEPGPQFIPFGPPGTVWEIRPGYRNGQIDFQSHLERGSFDRVARQGELVMRGEGDPENFLRVLFARLALERDAVLLHAAGILREGQGYVFAGASGSGKTTVARLSLAHTVLSDDIVILQLTGRGVRVWGVPFRGDMPEAPRTNASGPLRGLFLLRKDEVHRLEPIATVEAVARLAACVPFVTSSPPEAGRVMELCAAIQQRVPARELHFKRDADFWRTIDRG